MLGKQRLPEIRRPRFHLSLNGTRNSVGKGSQTSQFQTNERV
jgi:hypothetical protein